MLELNYVTGGAHYGDHRYNAKSDRLYCRKLEG
jgi:hypothetical protein